MSAVLRFWNIDHLGFQIWDEYHFVSGGRAIAAKFLGVQGIPGPNVVTWHTPPGMAVAVAGAFRLLGATSWAAISVSALAGTLTVLACYLLAAQLYSRLVGLLAAALLGLSEFSLMYSRMALTDALFALFMVVSLYLVWLASTRRSLTFTVLAGVSVGLLMNIKWNGWYPLFAAGGLFGVDLLAALSSRRLDRQARVELALRLRDLVVMGAVAFLLFLPWLLRVRSAVGFHGLLQSIGAYSVSHGPLLKTPLTTVARYFVVFVSLPTFLLAVLGLARAAWSRTRADWFVLIYAGGFLFLLSIYVPYPHLAYPLLPAVCTWAASGASLLADLSGRIGRYLWPNGAKLATGVTLSLLGLLMVASEGRRLPPLLTAETLGYQQAAEFIARRDEPSVIFTHLQANANLYLDPALVTSLAPSAETARRLGAPGVKYVVVDQTRTWDSRVLDLLTLNAGTLQTVKEIPNSIYGEVLVQPAYDDRFSYLSNPPREFRFITVYRTSQPLRIPSSWSFGER